jgi:hypothetical protein
LSIWDKHKENPQNSSHLGNNVNQKARQLNS